MPEGFPPDIDQYLSQEAPAPGAPGSLVREADSYIEAVRGALNAKYAVLLAYIAYGDQLRVVDRDGLYKHFQDHVGDERDWIYQLHRTLASRGRRTSLSTYPSRLHPSQILAQCSKPSWHWNSGPSKRGVQSRMLLKPSRSALRSQGSRKRVHAWN